MKMQNAVRCRSCHSSHVTCHFRLVLVAGFAPARATLSMSCPVGRLPGLGLHEQEELKGSGGFILKSEQRAAYPAELAGH